MRVIRMYVWDRLCVTSSDAAGVRVVVVSPTCRFHPIEGILASFRSSSKLIGDCCFPLSVRMAKKKRHRERASEHIHTDNPNRNASGQVVGYIEMR